MVNGDIFNAYSQYFNILENVGSYSQSNTARLLLMSFIQDMRNDGFIATLSDEDKKFIDKLEACIQDKVCIFPYTANCMKKKSYNVFAGDYEGCVTVNKKAALQYPYAPNITLDIYSPSDTAQVMLGWFNFNDYIITESTDYDLWFYTEWNPGQYIWEDITAQMKEWGVDNLMFNQEIGSDPSFGGLIEFNKEANGNYELLVSCSLQNGNNRPLALLNEGESVKGKLYYKITQPNNTFDIGLIEVVAHGRNRNRTPDFELGAHISCVTEGGKQTGYSVDNWTDENVFSPTYNQTEQRTTYNEDRCTKQTPTWETLSGECVVDGNGYNTGVYRVTRIDRNPNSPTYGDIETVDTTDYTSCPLNAPNWVLQSSACQLDGNNENTGYRVDTYKDTNPNSATYNTTREELVSDTTMCPTASTDPVWQETGRTCVMVQYTHSPNPGQYVYKNGTATVTYEDVNTHSASYGQTRTETVSDGTNCKADIVGFILFSDNSDTKSETYNYAARDYNVTMSCWKNDVVKPVSGHVSLTTQAGSDPNITAIINAAGIHVTLPANNTGVSRSATFIVTDIDSTGTHSSVTYTVTQTSTTDFKFSENNQTTLTKAAIAAGETLSVGVTSTAGGGTLGYTVQQADAGLTVSVVSGGISVVVAQNLTQSAKTMTTTLKQNTTNATITLTVNQAAGADNYVFTWTGGSVADKSLSAGSDGDSAAFTVVSTKNGSSQGFIISSTSTASSFATASINGSTVTVTVPANTGTTAQSGYFLLRQNDSGNELKINVNLAAPVFVFSWPSGLPNPAPLTVSHTHGTYTIPVTSTRNGVNVAYTIDSVSSSISAWTISRNTSDNSLVIQTTTGDRFNTITGDIVLKQNVSENTLTLNVTQQPEHVITPMLNIDSGSSTTGTPSTRRNITLTLSPTEAVNAALSDIIYGDLTIEFKGDTESDAHWEVAGPMSYIGSNQCLVIVDIGDHQWSDYFNVRLYKTSSTDTYTASSLTVTISISH